MDILSKEDFLSWAEECNWLCAGETATHAGRQVTYITPAGNFIYAIYNLKGDLQQLAFPIVQPQPTPGMQRPFLDLRGGAGSPG